MLQRVPITMPGYQAFDYLWTDVKSMCTSCGLHTWVSSISSIVKKMWKGILKMFNLSGTKILNITHT